MLNTPEYDLAKYLDGCIKPNIPDKYMLRSTSDFIDNLNNYPLKGNEKMVSFDVVSLFTNVPLIETIDIIIKRIYCDDAFSPLKFPNLFSVKCYCFALRVCLCIKMFYIVKLMELLWVHP